MSVCDTTQLPVISSGLWSAGKMAEGVSATLALTSYEEEKDVKIDENDSADCGLIKNMPIIIDSINKDSSLSVNGDDENNHKELDSDIFEEKEPSEIKCRKTFCAGDNGCEETTDKQNRSESSELSHAVKADDSSLSRLESQETSNSDTIAYNETMLLSGSPALNLKSGVSPSTELEDVTETSDFKKPENLLDEKECVDKEEGAMAFQKSDAVSLVVERTDVNETSNFEELNDEKESTEKGKETATSEHSDTVSCSTEEKNVTKTTVSEKLENSNEKERVESEKDRVLDASLEKNTSSTEPVHMNSDLPSDFFNISDTSDEKGSTNDPDSGEYIRTSAHEDGNSSDFTLCRIEAVESSETFEWDHGMHDDEMSDARDDQKNNSDSHNADVSEPMQEDVPEEKDFSSENTDDYGFKISDIQGSDVCNQPALKLPVPDNNDQKVVDDNDTYVKGQNFMPDFEDDDLDQTKESQKSPNTQIKDTLTKAPGEEKIKESSSLDDCPEDTEANRLETEAAKTNGTVSKITEVMSEDNSMEIDNKSSEDIVSKDASEQISENKEAVTMNDQIDSVNANSENNPEDLKNDVINVSDSKSNDSLLLEDEPNNSIKDPVKVSGDASKEILSETQPAKDAMDFTNDAKDIASSAEENDDDLVILVDDKKKKPSSPTSDDNDRNNDGLLDLSCEDESEHGSKENQDKNGNSDEERKRATVQSTENNKKRSLSPSCRPFSPSSKKSKLENGRSKVAMEVIDSDDDAIILTDDKAEWKQPAEAKQLEKKVDAVHHEQNPLCLSAEALQAFVALRVKAFIQKQKQEQLDRINRRTRGMQNATNLWKETAKHLEKTATELTSMNSNFEKRTNQRKAVKEMCSRTIGIQVSEEKVKNVIAVVHNEPKSINERVSNPPSYSGTPRQQTSAGQYQDIQINTPRLPPSQIKTGMPAPPPFRPQQNMAANRLLRPASNQPMQTQYHMSPLLNRPPLTSIAPQSSPQNVVNLIDLTDEEDSARQRASSQPLSSQKGPRLGTPHSPAVKASGKISTINGYKLAPPVPGVPRPPAMTVGARQGAPGMQPGSQQFKLVGLNTTTSTSYTLVPPRARAPNPNLAQRSPLVQQPAVQTSVSSNTSKLSLPPSTLRNAKHPAPLPQSIDNSPVRPGALKTPPKPTLKISRASHGIVLSWNMPALQGYEVIASYQLFAYQETDSTPTSSLWKKVGDVKALPLPMACTLTQFQEGNKYHFAVRAVDQFNRQGSFSDPSSIFLGSQN